MKRFTSALAGLGLLLLGVVLGQWVHHTMSPDPDAAAFSTLERAYTVIRETYVEPVPRESLSTSSIEGMVQSLDGYSDYVSPKRMAQVEEAFEGSFEGIGITYELIEGREGRDTIAVLSVVPSGPSDEVGVRAGDRIIRVDGESAIGWSHERIRDRLKGPRGSTVSVTLRRPGTDGSIDATITRDTVPLETIAATYMLDDSTGYVRLSRFARTTHREFTDALVDLTDKGMRRLILDLRGNAGGVMTTAEKIADEFLVEGQLIVTAHSRHDEFQSVRRATSNGQFHEAPLIVLIDEHSASASEIVAGAIQDHDRGVLVGRPTFGKGSVQKQYDLNDGSGLRLTVARFYTPTGRLMQRTEGMEDVFDTEAEPTEIMDQLPDSLVHRTDAGRLVVGGGGIRPEKVIGDRNITPYRRAVERRGIIQDFARRWMDARVDSLQTEWADRPEAYVNDFELSPNVYPAFVRFATEKGVDGRESNTEAARSEIETVIKSYVGRRLFGSSVAIRIRNRIDPVLVRARASWATAEEWANRYPVE